jgi:3',5'-cyclic AMP phosphodiesterase CpdA
MRNARAAIFFALLLSLPLFSQTSPQPAFIKVDARHDFRFVIFGDLRTAPPSDTSTTDPIRRRAIVDAISAEKPQFIVVTGDLVLAGSDSENWAQWDKETADWTKAKVAVFPALGNHDLNSNRSKALDNYFQRFPQLNGSRYYAARAGNVLLLTLDSSLPELEGPQAEWMKSMFDSVPAGVDFVLVSLHHPPLTRSHSGLRGGHSARPEETALAQWLEDRQKSLKARIIVVAGHVHNYERYERNGVFYVVSGGGGASPYSIPREKGDAYTEQGSTYHYCTASVSGDRLTLEMHKLDSTDGANSWRVADKVEIQSLSGQRAGRAANSK